MPSLGVKNKPLPKTEKYALTIATAPTTPAGEPLGEIEVAVKEHLAEKLPVSWSVEVTKSAPTPRMAKTNQSRNPPCPNPSSLAPTPVIETTPETLVTSPTEKPNQQVSPSESSTPQETPPVIVTPATKVTLDKEEDYHQSQSTPVSLKSRTLAALIDLCVASACFILFLTLFPESPNITPFIFATLYLLTKDSLGILNGQSIGKKLMKLRAVCEREKALTGNYRAGLLRNLSSLIAPIEFAILYVREDEANRGTRLGDDIAGTKVIPCNRTPPRKSKWI